MTNRNRLRVLDRNRNSRIWKKKDDHRRVLDRNRNSRIWKKRPDLDLRVLDRETVIDYGYLTETVIRAYGKKTAQTRPRSTRAIQKVGSACKGGKQAEPWPAAQASLKY